ncbi:MAG: fumarylacetoacetate hydrolase family protein [Candidatus Heimdallarchaeota archaeon]
MRIVRYKSDKGLCIGLWEENEIIDLTQLDTLHFKSFIDLAINAYEKKVSIEDLIKNAMEASSGDLDTYQYNELDKSSGSKRLVVPIDPPEVWGCGVTYKRSRAAREFETGVKGIYDLVYDSERPEIFFKGTASRCVGPNENIGLRGDSHWSVPEPELAFILGPKQKLVGFTGGNDVSARDIEGENPLYLPQAKIFAGCCALGPSIVTVEEVGTEPKLEIECEIFRLEKRVFKGSTNTAMMKRSIKELKSYLCRYNPIPAGSVCLTGTGIVPPDDFSLEEGDMVEISIEKIGKLRNRVERKTIL